MMKSVAVLLLTGLFSLQDAFIHDLRSSRQSTNRQSSEDVLLMHSRQSNLPPQVDNDTNHHHHHQEQSDHHQKANPTQDEFSSMGSDTNRRRLLQRTAITATSLVLSSPGFPSLIRPSDAVAAVTKTTAAASTAAAVTMPYSVPTPPFTQDLAWPLGKVAFSFLPLAGTSTRRATVEECIIRDTMWTHDQLQGIVNVNVPVRQTVIRLKDGGGGLWVHNPVAPTPQLLAMMKNLEDKYGPVRHIVLGTVALEHKATFGPFCQKFPRATVWIQPGQWSFPLNLPIDALGVRQKGRQLRELPVPGRVATNSVFRTTAKYGPPEWMDEIEYEVLGPLQFESVGAFSESAFYHKASQTLLVTDTVVSVSKNPPPIIEEDPRAMLFHARDNINEVVTDTPTNRQRGWRRMVQFGLVFFPSQISVVPTTVALKEAQGIDPTMSNLGDGAVPLNLYPWTWNGNSDERNFDVISKNGALFCPPILTKLILDREPQKTLEWVDRVVSRFHTMKRIIPCHLNNNVMASAKDFAAAFDPLRSSPGNVKPQRPLPQDLALLQEASDLLTKFHIVAPSQVCDGEEARIVGRFAGNL
jgi:hypothetical protein